MFVSPVYLQKSSRSQTTPSALAYSWRNLLWKLGVTLEMTVQAIEEQIHQVYVLVNPVHQVYRRYY